MLAPVSLLAALALVPWVQGLLLQTPVDWHSSSEVNITWNSVSSDVPFALQLFNTDAFHATFSIANNLQPSAGFASFQLGVIPQGQYTLRAISPTNASDIFDETPSFTIDGTPLSSSSSSASSTSSSGTSTGTNSGTSRPTSGASGQSTTSGFGVTVSNTNTAANTGSSSSSASTSAGSSQQTGGGNGFNGATTAVASWSAIALAAVAGAAALL